MRKLELVSSEQGEPMMCMACMVVHGPPVPCEYDATLPCRTCGKPRGYRWKDGAGKPARGMPANAKTAGAKDGHMSRQPHQF